MLIFISVFIGCKEEKESTGIPPLSPEEALNTFEIADGFRIELVAAEPLISDPVAMEIDEEGRMYVVEMHGYPLDKSGSGRVILLTDSNGDGKADKSTVFAEGLNLPTGIMRWKKGVIVTDAPDVIYLEDQNNDGKADLREVILTGFALSNPQHNLNAPLFGLDNWIYLAHEPAVTAKLFVEEFGDKGSEIVFPNRADAPKLPINAAGRNVRFRPDSFELEMLSGDTQFGQTFDSWGNHFLVSNAEHLMQEVIPYRYIVRNPDLLFTDVIQHLPDHGNAAEVFPITQNPEHQLLTDVGVMTSACGITSYLGGAFPDNFHESIFVAEPTHNVVHTDKLTSKGATFTGSRMFEEKEFLSSTDSWFRPVNFYIGPNGELYMLDYYRQIIEHPEWMSDEVIQSGELLNGADKGRIYKIIPNNFKEPGQLKLLSNASVGELVKALESHNIWWRRNAQRLLLDKNSPEAIDPLKSMAKESSTGHGRLHALWTLEGMGKLETSLIKSALQDQEAGVRKNAIILAELHLKNDPTLANSLFPLQKDRDAKVRFQLLCTLGEIPSAESENIRNQILFADVEDEWVHLAALSSPFTNPVKLFEKSLAQFSGKTSPESKKLFQQISATIGKRNQIPEIKKVIQLVTAFKNKGEVEGWGGASLTGLARGMRGNNYEQKSLLAERESLVNNYFNYGPEMRGGALQLLQILGLPDGKNKERVLHLALQIAFNQQVEAELRADALRILAMGDIQKYSTEIKTLVNPNEPAMVQLAAVQTLALSKGPEVSEFLLSQWNSLTPEIRDQGVDVFMKEPGRRLLLLQGIEDGIVQSTSLGWRRTVSLMNDHNDSIRAKARRLLEEKPGLREEVAKKYEVSLTLEGDMDNGKVIFQNSCSLCHQMGGEEGNAFGPDLATVKNRRPDMIIQDILIPNRSIADGYEYWEVKEKSGRILSGIIARESASAITLRQIGGMETTIPRDNIESLVSSKVSAMPPGLENQINEQEMADLLAYIKGIRVHQGNVNPQ